MEKHNLSEKLIIGSKVKQTKSQELLENLKNVSNEEIDDFSDSVKDRIAPIEKKMKLERIIENFTKRHVKVEENTTMNDMKGTTVHANIRWQHFDYFISDENYPYYETSFKEIVENQWYNSAEIEKMMVGIVKYLMSYDIGKEDIYPGSEYVESIKKALRLDSRYRLRDKNYKANYTLNCEKWGFSFVDAEKNNYNAKFLLKSR